jgi:hypothetical protein
MPFSAELTIIASRVGAVGRHRSRGIARFFRQHTAPASLDAFAPADRLDGMAAIKGRARRPANAPTVLVQLRVSPESRAILHGAAAASGVSVAQFADALMRYLDQEPGRMPLLFAPPPQSEELPIPAA